MRNSEFGMQIGRRDVTGGLFQALKQVVPRPSSLVFLSALLLFDGAVQAELVDRIVASVNNEVIALSELNQAIGFNRALGSGKGERIREETLEGLINRRLLIQEAHRLKFVEVSEEDVNAEIGKLKKRLGSDKAFSNFLAKLDTTADYLGRMLGERLLVERFVEKKIGLFIRVSRDEAQDYFNRNADRFKGKRFPEVQKVIIAGLQEQKLGQQMSQYLAELRNKADVRENP